MFRSLKRRFISKITSKPEYNFFKSPDRLTGKNNVASDKVNFRLDIRETIFLKEIRTSRVCVALKTIWS